MSEPLDMTYSVFSTVVAYVVEASVQETARCYTA
jgi:hypothetical protein